MPPDKDKDKTKHDGGWPGVGGTGTEDTSSGAAPAAPSTTSSAQTDLFDTGNLNTSVPITIDYGANPSPDLAKHLPTEDRYRPPSSGNVNDLLKRPITLFSQNKDAYVSLQQMLFQGGWFGAASKESIRFGASIAATQQAWLHLLEATQMAQTAGQDVTPDNILDQSVTEANKNQIGQGPSPLLIQHEDPKAIAAALQQAAQSTLGRDLSDAEVEHFISEYKAAEDAYGRQRQTANDATSGQRVDLTAPDLAGEAKQFVNEGHAGEADQQQGADYVGALEQMIGGL